MKYISRTIEKNLLDKIGNGKVIILYGPRQCGKTTLVKNVIKGFESVVSLNGDDDQDIEILSSITKERWNLILGSSKLLFIDEGQRFKDIGRAIKLLHDYRSDIQVILTGSSSFSLKENSEEALTGRKNVFTLLPLSFSELSASSTTYEEMKKLERRLIYGSYPEVVVDEKNAIENLKLLANSYLYKDLLQYGGIKKPEVLKQILKALAYRVGCVTSINALSSTLGYSKDLIESYITLLEEAFIIFPLSSYSSNLGNELKKGRKFYFYDNGILNTVKNNYSLLEGREDVGALFENYLVSERIKRNSNQGKSVESFFWRTTDKSEVDYIERENGKLYAYEIKWRKHAIVTKAFSNRYPEANLAVITSENYYSFLS